MLISPTFLATAFLFPATYPSNPPTSCNLFANVVSAASPYDATGPPAPAIPLSLSEINFAFTLLNDCKLPLFNPLETTDGIELSVVTGFGSAFGVDFFKSLVCLNPLGAIVLPTCFFGLGAAVLFLSAFSFAVNFLKVSPSVLCVISPSACLE